MILNYLKSIESFFQGKRKPLAGFRVWYCGSIPERDHWSHPLVDRDILEFTSVFSSLVFKYGGSIIHGSHPNFTPILKRSAEKFAINSSQLELHISSMFIDSDVREKGKFSEVIVPPSFKSNGEMDRDTSLLNLRLGMVPLANIAIFVGGKFHTQTEFRAGIPEEIKLAKKESIPSYILGGVDGAAKQFSTLENLKSVNSISSLSELEMICLEKNLSVLPSRIIGDMLSHKDLIL